MTPLEGLMMGTRAGSIDPGYPRAPAPRSPRPVRHESPTRSITDPGLLGVSGRSSDVRELLAAEAAGDEPRFAGSRAVRAAGRGGDRRERRRPSRTLDAVVFTGGIGEHSGPIRRRIVVRLGLLGISDVGDADIDEDAVLGNPAERPAVLRVAAREDAVIATAVRSVVEEV